MDEKELHSEGALAESIAQDDGASKAAPEKSGKPNNHEVISKDLEGAKWYVVHTYSGFERQAMKGLAERVRLKKKESFFSEILIPSENVQELVKGKKRTTNKKFFPGYILVKMILNDDTWHVVKETPKVTGFVGGKINPPSVPDKEILKITGQIADGTMRRKQKTSFEKGESVRVIEGPFVNFNGVVDEINPEKGRLRVLVSIFGRSTPVELDFLQVEKN